MRAIVLRLVGLVLLAWVVGCSDGNPRPLPPAGGGGGGSGLGGHTAGGSAGSNGSGPATCVAWHQVIGCSWTGPIDANADTSCLVDVPTGIAGYCECSTGDIATNCGHNDETCNDVCRNGGW